ncbi:MAG: AAA family ATPase [Bacteroidota bacterium]
METTIAVEVRSKIDALLQELCKGLYEREQAVKLALLSAVAGESIFLLGPPGVGKSLIARRLKHAFLDGTSFEYLMSKFSTPDEIFGPISIKKLKEDDQYKRLTDRYLPSANIVFLDEIWKAGPAIQNALLTILNEKIYRNGDEDMFVNINGIITASNELPPANKNLAPIWDRFLLRLELGGIKKFDNFLQMIVNTDDPYRDDISKSLKISQAELNVWDHAIDEVDVPAEVLNTIQLVKIKVETHNSKPNHLDNQIPVFDRRWKKIIRLLRTSAYLSGRTQVDLIDCFLMVHCLWAKPAQRELIQGIVSEAIRKHGYSMAVNLSMLKKEVQEFEEEVAQETKVKYTKVEERLLPVEEEYFELVKSDKKFEGSRISIKQFKNLSLSDQQVTNFYDENGSLVNRLKTKKGTQEYTIAVDYNSLTYTYRLKTQKVEKSEVIYRKAHDLLLEHWEERTSKIKKYMEIQLDKLQAQKTNHLDVSSLFVEKDLKDIVLSNLNDTEEVLKKLQIRLEKLAYAYHKE